jgi:subtilase family serine protease
MTPTFSILRWLLDAITTRGLSAPGSPKPPARPALTVEALEERSLLSATAFAPQAAVLPYAPSQTASPSATPGSTFYTPSQIQAAYGFNNIWFLNSSTNAGSYNQNAGKGQTIAIVDAYNDPTITQDANVFSSGYGLPTFNTGGPVLDVVNQSGGSALPPTNTGWATETALDVEWAHAIAPQANIVLVEANSTQLSDLLSGVNYAASRAPVVSMSWGGGEFASETSFDSMFASHPQVTFVAAAGDNGAAANYPAVSPNVLSVGGTSLSLSSTGQWAGETAWGHGSSGSPGSGGGYSQYETEPGYQKLGYPISVGANGYRMGPDVAYDADPNTGFPVYDSTGHGGWVQAGGTSAGAPQWAALIALADQGRGSLGSLGSAQVLGAFYTMAGSAMYGNYFHDVTSGNNGNSSGPGYDLVTGLGTPQADNIVGYLVNHIGTGTATSAAAFSSPATSSASPALAQAMISEKSPGLEPAVAQPALSTAPAGGTQQGSDAHLAPGLLAQLDGAGNPLLTGWLQDTDSYRLALSALLANKQTPLA